MEKALLLGMNNPLSDDPKFDLYPYPPNCTGYRLWMLLPEGTPRQRYLDGFDRLNLLRSREWNAAEAKAAGARLLPTLMGRTVVVLGVATRRALGLPDADPLSVQFFGTLKWVAFPHPSGRNPWFNNAGNRSRARALLWSLIV